MQEVLPETVDLCLAPGFRAVERDYRRDVRSPAYGDLQTNCE